MVSELSVRQAFNEFEAGVLPDGYRPPKAWYVVDHKTRRAFPAKAIWALATDQNTGDFKTGDARRAFLKVGNGYECVRIIKFAA